VGKPFLLLAARDVNANFPFANARGFSGEVAEIVELGATDASAANDRDGRDHRAVHREDSLDSDAARDLADGESLADSAAAARDAHTLEGLETLLVTFFDADIDAQRIAGAEGRHVSAEPFFLGFDKWMHIELGGKGWAARFDWGVE